MPSGEILPSNAKKYYYNQPIEITILIDISIPVNLLISRILKKYLF